MVKKPTVFVAMSGGVDSSVAAALLKKRGYNIVGVFMKNWNRKVQGMKYYHCTRDDLASMESVCEYLKIPHRVFNFEKEYQKRVLDYFFSEYKAGRTPNPDVMCNKEIKFKPFLEQAVKEGADFIATGHHIRRRSANLQSPISNLQRKQQYWLLKGIDPIKDQTYFVYNLDQKQLAKCLFPIGKYTKPQVREIASRLKLPSAYRKDSQGICFIGQVDIKEFLETKIRPKKGKIVNQAGEVLGEHDGAWFYTIGQRRIEGLSGHEVPLYVISTDVKKNLVVVGPDKATYAKGVILENLHLIDPRYFQCHPELVEGSLIADSSTAVGMTDRAKRKLTAKPRYGPDVYPGRLEKHDRKPVPSQVEGWHFIFDQPQRALTPGQSLVIYDKEVCLGGGVISQVIR